MSPRRPLTLVAICSAALAATALHAAWQPEVYGTRDSKVYHTRDCSGGQRISPERRVEFDDESAAQAAGRRKCKLCARLEAEGKSGDTTNDAGDGKSKSPRRPARAASQPATTQPARGAEHASSARIIAVLDGDTLKLESGQRLRLIGVTCPARKQAIGGEALRFVEKLVLDRTLSLIDDPANDLRHHEDRWGRRLAFVRLPDGRDLSQALIEAGLGWADRYHRGVRADEFKRCEQTAQRSQRGIWAPLPPPHGHELVKVSPAGFSYHASDCPHLKKVREPQSMTLNEAKAAGYTPCSEYDGP